MASTPLGQKHESRHAEITERAVCIRKSCEAAGSAICARSCRGASAEEPRRDSRRTGQEPRSGARAGPLRADARLALHLLQGGPTRSCRPTWRRFRTPGCGRSSAGMLTSQTSALSRRRTAGRCSTSTTSTRRSPVRSNGRQAAGRELCDREIRARSAAATTGSLTPAGTTVRSSLRPPGWRASSRDRSEAVARCRTPRRAARERWRRKARRRLGGRRAARGQAPRGWSLRRQ